MVDCSDLVIAELGAQVPVLDKAGLKAAALEDRCQLLYNC